MAPLVAHSPIHANLLFKLLPNGWIASKLILHEAHVGRSIGEIVPHALPSGVTTPSLEQRIGNRNSPSWDNTLRP